MRLWIYRPGKGLFKENIHANIWARHSDCFEEHQKEMNQAIVKLIENRDWSEEGWEGAMGGLMKPSPKQLERLVK